VQVRDIIITFLNIRLENRRITDIKDVKSFRRFVPDLNCKQPFQLSCASLMMQTKNININVMCRNEKGEREREGEKKKRKIMRRCIILLFFFYVHCYSYYLGYRGAIGDEAEKKTKIYTPKQ
jgi:hypothetical protein